MNISDDVALVLAARDPDDSERMAAEQLVRTARASWTNVLPYFSCSTRNPRREVGAHRFDAGRNAVMVAALLGALTGRVWRWRST